MEGEYVWVVGRGRVALRAEPSHRSEQVSELLWGEPQQVLTVEQGWVYVRGEWDGYAGWVPVGALLPAWQEGHGWAVVVASRAPLYQNGRQIGWVPLGSVWPKTGLWRTAVGDYTTFPELLWPWEERRVPLRRIIRAFRGAPYHWGGKTPTGTDCSGLTQMAYRLAGRRLPRDAYQQAQSLSPTQTPQRGDLVFFSSAAELTRITHVGLYLGEGQILHATPAAGVHVASLAALFTHRFHSFRTWIGGDFVI